MRLARLVWRGLLLVTAMILPAAAQSLVWSWSNPQPHGNNIIGMAWNGTLGVQVCELGRIYTSPDLINWFPQTSHLTNDLQAVTFFNQRIVVTGSYGAVAYSDDGVNFTAGSLNTPNWLVSVAASSNLCVTVGDNGALYTSTDGANWHLQSPPPNLGGFWLLSVAYGNGVFVTTGEQGYIATSRNGTNWTSHSIASSFGQLENVTWVNSSGSHAIFPYTGFWTVSDAGDAFYSTTNGATWTQFNLATQSPSTNVLYTIATGTLTGLVAGANEARLGASIAGQVTWREQTGPGFTNAPQWTYFASALSTNGVYELAGYDGMIAQSYLTNGGYNWGTPYYSARDWLFQVKCANGLYVAVGDNIRVMTSDDGADWTVEEIPLTNSISSTNTTLLSVDGTTNLLLTAGTHGSLALSPNMSVAVVETNADGSLSTNEASSFGIVWYSMPPPTGTTNDLAGVGVFSNNFYLIGGNGTILNSPDGTNWSRLSSPTSNYLSGISISTNGLLVLTGNEGTILTSANGSNWTSHASGTTNWLYRLRCVGGRLLAVGENGTILSSTNGTNWTSLHSGVTNWLNDAVMISNTCYVVGNQGVVLASTNFTAWTDIGTITSASLDGVATQNGQLVAVGFEGTILRSQVVPVLTPVNFIDIGQADGYNVFSVAGVLDQQFTLDSTTNLVNWITGPQLDLYYGDGTLIFYEPLPTNAPPSQYFRCTVVP
jgi:hypothetical protein